MFARVTTVAFEGIEARAVDVQVQIGPGLPAFAIVGLPDKAVAESRERVRGALNVIGLALPPPRVRTNAECDGALLEEKVARIHIAEALSYRGETLRRAQEAA